MELPKIEPVSDDISLLTPVQMWGKFFLYASKLEKRNSSINLQNATGGLKWQLQS